MVVATLLGGVAHAVLIAIAGAVEYSYGLVAVGFVTIAASAVFAGEGRVDPAAGTVDYCGDELPLGAIRSFRAVGFAGRVVVLPRYRGGVPTASRAVTFSREAYAAAEPLLRAGVRGDSDALGPVERPRRLPRAVRITAAVIATGMVSVAAAVHLLAPPDLAVVVPLLVAGEIPVIAVLLWYAYAG
ncbi:hypothetical protein ACFQFH_05025 [Halobaculum halobium]